MSSTINNSITALRTKTTVASIVDASRSRKTYKKLLKATLNTVYSEELYSNILNTYIGTNLAIGTTTSHYRVMLLPFGYSTLEEFFNHPLPALKAGKEAWNIYNMCQAVFYSALRGELTITSRDAKELLGVLLDTFSSTKQDTVIGNTLMVRIARALSISEETAMSHLDVWCNTGIISHQLIRNGEDGKMEHMYSLHIDLVELRASYRFTSNRNVKLSIPKDIEGNISIAKKIRYDQILGSSATKAFNHIQETAFSLRMTLDELEEAILRKLFGKNWKTSRITTSWEQEIASAMRAEYHLIMDSGNIFYVESNTDSVLRLYNTSEYFGVQQGSWMREHMTLAYEEEITPEGYQNIRDNIAFHILGKVTFTEARSAFDIHCDEWRDAGHCPHLFEALDSAYTKVYSQQDAQSQNYGIYGLVTGNMPILEHTGFAPYRSDFRDVVAVLMNDTLDTDMWTKDTLKPAVMTKGYSAGYKTIMFGSNYDEENGYINPKGKAIPLMSVSKHSAADTWSAFNRAMSLTVGRALNVMSIIQKDGEKNKKDLVQWTMPDGEVAQVALLETVETHVKWVGADGHVHTITHHISVPSPARAYTTFAARIIQSIDAFMFRRVAVILADMGIAFTAVHDEYITHINYDHIVREVYRIVALEVFDGNLLSNIMNQITGKTYNFQSGINRETVRNFILNSEYALAY